MRTVVVALLLAALVAVLGAAARAHRPAPFGDDLAAHSTSVPADAVRLHGDAVQGYDDTTGITAWTYRRPGSTPTRIVPLAHEVALVAWSDGMLTGVTPGAPEIRWHRFIKIDEGGRPLLHASPGGETFLAVTSGLFVAYNTDDGTIRTDTLPPPGCSYVPAHSVSLDDGTLVVARSCPGDGPSAVDAFTADGRIWKRDSGPDVRPVLGTGGSLALCQGPLLRGMLVDPATGAAVPDLPGAVRQPKPLCTAR
jgi:hypothetical protein